MCRTFVLDRASELWERKLGIGSSQESIAGNFDELFNFSCWQILGIRLALKGVSRPIRFCHHVQVKVKGCKLFLCVAEMLSHHLRGRLNNFIVSQELAELQEGFICCLQSISLPEINFLRESCDSITQLMDVGVLSLETCIPFIHFPKYACDIG